MPVGLYMRVVLICAMLAVIGCTDPAPPSAGPSAPPSTPAAAAVPADARPVSETVAGYDALLKAHVDADGWVDYAAVAADRAGLDAYVASLARTQDPAASDAVKLAHLINAYNALTLQMMIDAGPPASIMDLHGGKPWDVAQWNLGGEIVSLNQIEHQLIRPVFAEPRIHWALVCAAYSCPPLRNEAYTAERLEAQLAAQEAYVLNFAHPRYAVQAGDAVRVSPLFDWYGDDFVTDESDAKGYAASRLGVDAAAIRGFLDYDWKLNDVSNRPGG